MLFEQILDLLNDFHVKYKIFFKNRNLILQRKESGIVIKKQNKQKYQEKK